MKIRYCPSCEIEIIMENDSGTCPECEHVVEELEIKDKDKE